MTRKHWERRVYLPVIFALLFVAYVCAILFLRNVQKHEDKKVRPTSILNTRLENPVTTSREAKNFQRLAASNSRLLADFRDRVSDVKDGCLSMCYDVEINPHEWLLCLVRSWGITGFPH